MTLSKNQIKAVLKAEKLILEAQKYLMMQI